VHTHTHTHTHICTGVQMMASMRWLRDCVCVHIHRWMLFKGITSCINRCVDDGKHEAA